jgi:hypothetical protein
LIEYVNRIETVKEVNFIEKIIQENSVNANELSVLHHKDDEKNLALFSWRTSTVVSHKGHGGNFDSIFGANRIIIDNLPLGKTTINVNSIFGLVEIVVSKNVKLINKIKPIFAGVFASDEINKEGGDLPELYIMGSAIFGNITIKRV